MLADRITVQGMEIAYQAVGPEDRPAVVLLHGWASSRRMWEAAQASLAGGYRTFAVDLPGHGESTKPSWSWYSIPNYVDVVLHFCEALGLKRPAAVGHSMGGTIALELAAQAPTFAEKIVVVNPVVTGRVYARALPLREAWVEPAVRVSRRVWPAASRLLTRPPQALRRHAPGHVLRNSEDFGMTTADSALGSMKAVLTWDVSDRLGQIQAKTLIVVGEGDRIVSPAEGEAAARRIRRAQLLRLEAAHHPNDEIPDVFHPLLASFLSEGDAI
ncbi:MAG TPA: alpha/beta hydrolase [Anaerolineales bacterium]|nr:alpha/beta hydrolase [Anaerolineales bacterium]